MELVACNVATFVHTIDTGKDVFSMVDYNEQLPPADSLYNCSSTLKYAVSGKTTISIVYIDTTRRTTQLKRNKTDTDNLQASASGTYPHLQTLQSLSRSEYLHLPFLLEFLQSTQAPSPCLQVPTGTVTMCTASTATSTNPLGSLHHACQIEKWQPSTTARSEFQPRSSRPSRIGPTHSSVSVPARPISSTTCTHLLFLHPSWLLDPHPATQPLAESTPSTRW